MLRFSVFDHDVLSFNDFAGEAYFSLNQVQGIIDKKNLVSSSTKQYSPY